jgi:integrase
VDRSKTNSSKKAGYDEIEPQMKRAATAAPRRDPASGKWGFVVDAVGEDGKRHQARRRGFPTKKAAQEVLDAIRTAVRQESFVRPSKMTLREFVETTWLPGVKVKLDDSTLSSYRRNLQLHVLPRIGHLRLAQVGPDDLNRVYSELQQTGRRDGKAGGLSDRTVRYIATITGRVFEDAVRWNHVLRNPARRADPPSERGATPSRPRPWSPSELADFLSRCGDNRYRPLYTFLALTGCRRGEALGLHWADIEDGIATIHSTITAVEHKVKVGGQTKTGKVRQIELDAPTLAALRIWRARQAQERLLFGTGYPETGLVFCHPDGRPYHPERVSREFDRMVQRLKLRRVRLHDLRHGWATMALKAGVHPKIVQERLGHSNIGVTLNIYSHTDLELRAGAAAKVAGLVFGT